MANGMTIKGASEVTAKPQVTAPVAEKHPEKRYSVTARELIKELVSLDDLDQIVQISFFGSNPCNLQDVEVSEDSVILSGGM